jgi:HD-like signal output (HDOD) protein
MSDSSLLEREVLQAVLESMRLNTLKLPTLPEQAIRVRAVAADPGVSLQTLAQEVGRDAALAARVIRVANSPLVRARNEIKSLQQAITRLGLDYVRDLVTVFALEGAFTPKHRVVGQALFQIWSTSKDIAAICSVLAKRSSKVSPDQALLAGLMHAIGALPLLAAVDARGDIDVPAAELRRMVEEIHGELGTQMLRAWRFSESLACVPELYRDPFREHNGPADLVDVVAVADVMLRHSQGRAELPLEWPEIPPMLRLGLQDDPDVAENFSSHPEVTTTRGSLA